MWIHLSNRMLLKLIHDVKGNILTINKLDAFYALNTHLYFDLHWCWKITVEICHFRQNCKALSERLLFFDEKSITDRLPEIYNLMMTFNDNRLLYIPRDTKIIPIAIQFSPPVFQSLHANAHVFSTKFDIAVKSTSNFESFISRA